MYTETLIYYLSNIVKYTTVKTFGVFAKDELDIVDFSRFPIALIINTDERRKSGKHWFALYLYKECEEVKVDFFDSYGNAFSKYRVKFPFKISLSNYRQVQQTSSSVCGAHCLFFLYYRSRGLTLPKILKKYSRNFIVNDNMVRLFVSLLQSKSDPPKAPTQTCCSRKVSNL